MENVHANACVQAFKKLIFVRLTIYIQVWMVLLIIYAFVLHSKSLLFKIHRT
jgi:hypothetical protein